MVIFRGGYYTQKISVGRIISAEDVGKKLLTGSRHVEIEFDCFGKGGNLPYVVDNNK